MIETEFKFLRFLLFFGLSLCSVAIFAQNNGIGIGPDKDNPQTLTVISTGSLEFGKFSRQNGGSITIDPNSNVSKTGDIFLLSSLRSNVRFDISTNRGNSNVVNVMAAPITLTGAGGSLPLTMIFDNDTFILDKDRPATIYMGGTLSVDSQDSAGFYTGTVNVIFAYQ